ncbi:hypothetical protein A3D84_00500 [Candidatus Woesebacteria bacterium RIFCSPHIGHO2_02_FULL_42_20]|uniref:Uncharacterized protein n=1 Tax=Candidatus Woesebacteria bacterium RIFCSPHIGHO2_12_FULL_41_24 TaxID=1802510 RepID=A0A1F8ATT1_9BACT|nr:MAG: hypothetical protein A2W15_02005 [Candidatus Woesebacteria bacterium RBG_16_41_13]OGM29731.1 MAG: hypothetical protein A2873_02425 [Candidatus Woesebacteria bacterium RIFCSPHIGHO2_01_FULL_42_80]OGM35258.1 MAG: hypothetical protein A3D84_00500 [Candidatus Woesebacteria bacterium RIFCSPHIGHO2_02_FULL_42_20]OGM55153.1 MAG: hypothetical protein A3E44_04510 [Candidatus Woesebacteria bacterium RIFCSPHIGHO2_12_FULL_41_24]OGM67725.1 MAG: hypothetical protein A2969_02215 [Candidatus Woesebacteri
MDPVIRNVNPPVGLRGMFNGNIEVVPLLLQIVVSTLIFGAGLFALFNFVLAGYAFLSAGDDPKKVQGASTRLLNTLLGLLFAAGSTVLAAIFGKLIFNDWGFLLQFKVFGP